MSDKWSDKDEYQYKQVKKTIKERGASEKTAEEAAARAVNKRREYESAESGKRPSVSRVRKEQSDKVSELDIQDKKIRG